MRRVWATEATARRAASIHRRVGVAAPPTGWVSPCRGGLAGGRLHIVPSRETGERLLLTTTTERSPPPKRTPAPPPPAAPAPPPPPRVALRGARTAAGSPSPEPAARRGTSLR